MTFSKMYQQGYPSHHVCVCTVSDGTVEHLATVSLIPRPIERVESIVVTISVMLRSSHSLVCRLYSKKLSCTDVQRLLRMSSKAPRCCPIHGSRKVAPLSSSAIDQTKLIDTKAIIDDREIPIKLIHQSHILGLMNGQNW